MTNHLEHVLNFDINQILTFADYLGIDMANTSFISMQYEIEKHIVRDASQPTDRKRVIIFSNTPYKLSQQEIIFRNQNDSYKTVGPTLRTSKNYYQILKNI